MQTTKYSYTSGASVTPLLGDTIGQNLQNIVLKFPNQDAIVNVEQNFRCTYSELWTQTTQICKSLIASGLVKGDRVGIWAPNRYEWTLIQFATARIGLIMVTINPSYRSSELEYVLQQSGIKTLFSNATFKTSNYKAIVKTVYNNCPELEQVIYFEEDWNTFLAQASMTTDQDVIDAEHQVQFDDPVNIQYTSGTTGFPKGATLTHHNVLNNGFFIGERLHYSANDKVCIPVPFYHCFGMVIGNLACATHGATMVIPSAAFSPKDTLHAVQQEQCTSLYGVPTMFIAELALADFDQYDLSSLRTGVMAGSPCPIEVMKQVHAKMNMKEISVCYGMTETSPVSLQTKIGTPIEKQVSTVGQVMDHLEIKIADSETGAILPIGCKGELCTRGYSVMLKYWNNPIATDAVIDEYGWMHSGDEGIMDEEGYVTITGRIKDMIIRGGENISPKEIEDFLYTHESILDVQVIGVPDPKYGEEIMAWIILKPNNEPNEEALIAYCKQQIAHYKIPKYWKYVTEFPMTVTGKIKKQEMRDIAKTEL